MEVSSKEASQARKKPTTSSVVADRMSAKTARAVGRAGKQEKVLGVQPPAEGQATVREVTVPVDATMEEVREVGAAFESRKDL